VPRLWYYPEKFPAYMGVAFSAPSSIDFTWSELCKSAVTVGRSRNDILKYGPFSTFELMWRLAVVWANLTEDPVTEFLRPTEAFDALDPSEKGAISYFLGNVFTKLVVEKLFGVTWLLHFDVYRYSMDLNAVLAFNQRPDFVGLDPRQQWAVVESKGHRRAMRRDTMEKAKRQTRSLRTIKGQYPALRTAVGVWFSRTATSARIWDPHGYDDDAQDFPIDADRFLRLYYEPLIAHTGLLQAQPGQKDQTGKLRRGADLQPFDAQLFVDDDIVTSYAREVPLGQTLITAKTNARESILEEMALLEETRELRVTGDVPEKLHLLVDKQRTSDIGQADDGVTVALGPAWRPENMRRNPANRSR
jgi:hypothetical protein